MRCREIPAAHLKIDCYLKIKLCSKDQSKKGQPKAGESHDQADCTAD